MNVRNRSLLVAALAGALALPATSLLADDKPKDEGVPCWGINTCKAHGDCSNAGCREHGCSGSNACAGQGFVRLPQESCLKIKGGRLTKEAAKPAQKTAKKAGTSHG